MIGAKEASDDGYEDVVRDLTQANKYTDKGSRKKFSMEANLTQVKVQTAQRMLDKIEEELLDANEDLDQIVSSYNKKVAILSKVPDKNSKNGPSSKRSMRKKTKG